MLIAGIDPGANGAIAVLDSKNPDSVALLDLKKNSTYCIYLWLLSQLSKNCSEKPYIPESQIWVEDIHSMYGMSAKSNFTFGKNLGTVLTISAILKRDTPKMITPKVWQKYIGVTAKGKAIKQDVAKIAQGLYPSAELHGKKGGLLDGRSDALMIAHYGLHNKEKG